MAPYLDAKGRPVRMSFLDLFGPSKPSRGGKGAGTKKKEGSASTETSPSSVAATAGSSEPDKPTESASPEWSKMEEMALLGMKARNMTWKEIEEALPGKNLEVIKKKYKELYDNAPASSKPKEEDNAKKEEGKEGAPTNKTSKETTEDEKSGKEDKQGKKNQKGQKGKEKTKEVKPGESKPVESKGIFYANTKAEKKGEIKFLDGHPVIFVDDNEELSFEELIFLYELHARYDQNKWITVDSKFFDKFGKRVGAEKLKEKLTGNTL